MQAKPQSFATRLSLYIVSVVGGLFLISFAVYYYSVRETIINEAFKTSQSQLSLVIKSIDTILEGVELSVNNAVCYINEEIDSPDSFQHIINNMISSNPSIYGASIAIEPFFYKPYGRYYMLYGCKAGDEIEFEVLGSEEYDYHIMDWYQIPKLLDKDYWSEPYFDIGGGNTLMTTFTKLLRDKNNKVIGVITADVSLEWLSQMVLANKPYEDSYAFMLSRNAYYLVHRDKDRILSETFYTATANMTDPQVKRIGEEMLSQQSGHRRFYNDDVLSYAFYEPILRIGWSAGTVSTESSVMAEFNRMTRMVLIIAICGLLLIFIFTVIIIQNLTRPLKIFSQSASIVAQGNFDTPIPEIRSRDEMYELRNSFVNMQHSLKSYVAELQTTTAIKERIESELEIANQIQMGMLPKVFPPFPEHDSIDLFAKLTPAKEVGGDLYDFFILDDKLFFTVGDASGKGIPASLLMVVTSSLFRFIASQMSEPDKILENLNNAIAENNEANMFITLFVGVLDLSTGELVYSNAGHNPPVLINEERGAEFINTYPNLALGVFPNIVFKSQRIDLHQGDAIFLYSDGLTEAENSAKDLYSESRLIDILNRIDSHSSPRMAVDLVEQSVNDFVQGNEQSDDLTMMMITFK